MIRFGVHHTQAPAATVRDYPGVTTDRAFIPGVLRRPDAGKLITAHRRAVRTATAAGIHPIVSVKIDPDVIRTGRWGPTLTAYARHMRARGETAPVAYWHEPENDMTGQSYSDAFARVRDALHTGDPDLPVGYIAMAYQWLPKTPSTAVPGHWRVVADWYGIDAYSGGSVPADTTVYEHPGVIRWREELLSHVNAWDRWIITERGFASGDDRARADTIRRESAALADDDRPPLAYIYWNTPGAEGNKRLVNGPRADRALRKMIAEHRQIA